MFSCFSSVVIISREVSMPFPAVFFYRFHCCCHYRLLSFVYPSLYGCFLSFLPKYSFCLYSHFVFGTLAGLADLAEHRLLIFSHFCGYLIFFPQLAFPLVLPMPMPFSIFLELFVWFFILLIYFVLSYFCHLIIMILRDTDILKSCSPFER